MLCSNLPRNSSTSLPSVRLTPLRPRTYREMNKRLVQTRNIIQSFIMRSQLRSDILLLRLGSLLLVLRGVGGSLLNVGDRGSADSLLVRSTSDLEGGLAVLELCSKLFGSEEAEDADQTSDNSDEDDGDLDEDLSGSGSRGIERRTYLSVVGESRRGLDRLSSGGLNLSSGRRDHVSQL